VINLYALVALINASAALAQFLIWQRPINAIFYMLFAIFFLLFSMRKTDHE